MNISPEQATQLQAIADGENVRSIDGARRAQTYEQTDLGNAERFTQTYGDRFRYDHDMGVWLEWTGTYWSEDRDGGVKRAAAELARQMLRDAAELPKGDLEVATRHALKAQSEARILSMLALAKNLPPIAATSERFDTDDYAKTVANGTIDLRAGKLRAADPGDLITTAVGIEFDPAAECPRWNQFLGEVFAGDEELIEFVQRFVGYSLTGDTKEHVLVLFQGGGCNGKTVFVRMLGKLLGNHGATSTFDSFLRSRGDKGPRDDLARLRNARLVTATESGEGRKIDDATVKALTGGDTIAARPLYGKYVEFRPKFKIVLTTNYLPKVDGGDDAIWRRLRLVPFDVSFEGREDRELTAKLEAELPGILAWAVRGCLKWQAEGLPKAAAVVEATREYRHTEDLFGQFLEDRCTLDADARTATADLMAAYTAYCDDLGEKPMSKAMISRRVGKRGVTCKPSNGKRTYFGIGVGQ